MVFPILKVTVRPLTKLFIRDVKGISNIPKDKGFIIACNHASYLDDFVVPTIIVPKIDKVIHFYINHLYFKNFILRSFLEHTGGIRIDVSKSKESKKINNQGLNKAINYLRKKDPVAIFPEGSRSMDGKIKKAKTGIAFLLLKAKVPVLPIGIIGSDKILPKGKFFPRFKRCDVNIGKLLYFDNYYNKKINKKILEEITKKIMKKIALLSNKKYNH